MHFGDKACAVEDLLPYIAFGDADLRQWTSFLESHKAFVSFTRVVSLAFSQFPIGVSR